VEEMLDNRIIRGWKHRMRIIVGSTEAPEPVIDVPKQLNDAIKIIAMPGTEVRYAVSDLSDFLQLCSPDRLRRQKGLEQPPVLGDDPTEF